MGFAGDRRGGAGGGGIDDQRRGTTYDFAPMQSRPLNYAAAVPLHANRKVRRLIVTAVLFVCVFVGWGIWGLWQGYLRERIAAARCWSRAEQFVEPPNTVVFTTDKARIPSLARASYRSWRSGPHGRSDAWREPSVWFELQLSRHSIVSFDPCPFLHSRAAPGQQSRIVAVEVDLQGIQPGEQLSERLLVRPQTLSWSRPSPQPVSAQLNTSPSLGLTIILNPNEPLTIFAGQPDPADASHFTIGYTLSGKPGTIDGRLLGDGTVKLTVRHGPLFGRTEDSLP